MDVDVDVDVEGGGAPRNDSLPPPNVNGEVATATGSTQGAIAINGEAGEGYSHWDNGVTGLPGTVGFVKAGSGAKVQISASAQKRAAAMALQEEQSTGQAERAGGDGSIGRRPFSYLYGNLPKRWNQECMVRN